MDFFHWVEQLHCTDTFSRKLILNFWLLATLLLAPLLHSCSLDGMPLSQPGAEKKSLHRALPETPFGDALPHAPVPPPVPSPPDSPARRSRPGTHPLFQPRGKALSAPSHSLRDGPAAAPTPSPTSARRSPSAAHTPDPAVAGPPGAGAAIRPEDRARRCGASHLCEEPGAAGPGAGAGAGRPRRGWHRCSRRSSWRPRPPLPPAHCRFRPVARGMLGTVVSGCTARPEAAA